MVTGMVIGCFFIGRNNKYGEDYQLSLKERNEFLTLSPQKDHLQHQSKGGQHPFCFVCWGCCVQLKQS